MGKATRRTSKTVNQCTICSARFARSSDLSRHVRGHTGEKPYKCDECGKNFAQAAALKNHRNSHTGEKPFQCGFCPSSFGDPSSCSRHRREKHSGFIGYECQICLTTIKRRSSFIAHIERKHQLNPDEVDINELQLYEPKEEEMSPPSPAPARPVSPRRTTTCKKRATSAYTLSDSEEPKVQISTVPKTASDSSVTASLNAPYHTQSDVSAHGSSCGSAHVLFNDSSRVSLSGYSHVSTQDSSHASAHGSYGGSPSRASTVYSQGSLGTYANNYSTRHTGSSSLALTLQSRQVPDVQSQYGGGVNNAATFSYEYPGQAMANANAYLDGSGYTQSTNIEWTSDISFSQEIKSPQAQYRMTQMTFTFPNTTSTNDTYIPEPQWEYEPFTTNSTLPAMPQLASSPGSYSSHASGASSPESPDRIPPVDPAFSVPRSEVGQERYREPEQEFEVDFGCGEGPTQDGYNAKRRRVLV